jgi:putative addiction module killer protein
MGNKLRIVEYICEGKSSFERWFNSLDAVSAAKVSSALYKLELGNYSNVKSAGRGVMEYRINYGPG